MDAFLQDGAQGLDSAVIAFRVAFSACAALFVLNLCRHARVNTIKTSKPLLILTVAFSLSLFLILLHQSYWQLAGFRHPKLVHFMQRYSRRVAGGATSMQRGRIVDRSGLVLAETMDGQRHYPHGRATAHVTGYIDRRFGKTGVEQADDAHLDGSALSTEPADLMRLGRNLLNHRLITGHDTVLTIDAALQNAAMELMGDDRGAIVAIDPRNGHIRILFSSPTLDPAAPQEAISGTDSPMLNRCLNGLYPPGSTFKMLIAAVATEYGMGGPLNCPANGISAVSGARPIRDHEYYAGQREGKAWGGHGTISIPQAIARSSNVYFAQLGLIMGAERLMETSQRFHLSAPFTIFEGASGGIGASTCNMPRLDGNNRRAMAQVSIGQGALLVTPLHMAVAAATIANHGTHVAPTLRPITETTPEQVITRKTAAILHGYLEGVVKRGTGRGAAIHGLRLAGKTGTAQTPSGIDHGWFVAFAPLPAPTLALAIVVENSGYGSRRAVPIARQLFLRAREMGLLDPGTQGSQP